MRTLVMKYVKWLSFWNCTIMLQNYILITYDIKHLTQGNNNFRKFRSLSFLGHGGGDDLMLSRLYNFVSLAVSK
jgi:hypothetical protein